MLPLHVWLSPVTQGIKAFGFRALKRFYFQSVQCPEPDSLQHRPEARCSSSHHLEGCSGRLSSICWLPAAYCHSLPRSVLAASEKTQSQEGKGLNTQLPQRRDEGNRSHLCGVVGDRTGSHGRFQRQCKGWHFRMGAVSRD